jgi:L-amino acid N-acyltransferase YncA
MMIRNPKESDLPAITQIYADWYVDLNGKIQNEEVVYWAKQVKDSIENINKIHYLISADNNEIATGIIGWRGDIPIDLKKFTKKSAVELYGIFMRKQFQRQGIGRALMNVFYKNIQGKYDEVILLSADRFKASWKFYEALEFEHVGDLPYKHSEALSRIYRKEIIL